MQLFEVVVVSRALADTTSRTAKRDIVADLLRVAGPDVPLVTGFLTSRPRQRRTGVGFRSLSSSPPPAPESTLTLTEVDDAFQELADAAGAGVVARRTEVLTALMQRATADEQAFLADLLRGEVRHGALDGVMEDAIARAADVPLATVRRAAMLSGSLVEAAQRALAGGRPALEEVGLRVGVPIQPMLAGSAPTVDAAWQMTGDAARVVDAKIDGIRIQVHRRGDEIAVYSRTLDDLTERLPDVVAAVAALPVRDAILDGEAIALDDAGRPRLFQDTSARVARRGGDGPVLDVFWFDALHLDGDDLIDLPLAERRARLQAVAPGRLVPHLITDDAEAAQAFMRQTLADGFEGVVIKPPDAPYAAGRRGRHWVKVKPVRTFDLVVLGVEWGSGRRQGTLSNIHLGARDHATGGFVMVGKTFKGMTDAILAWQTARFLELETHRDSSTVHVRPEQVVEIAIDGVQRSRRYPGGVALRFARVIRYRDDKAPHEADTIDTLRALLP